MKSKTKMIKIGVVLTLCAAVFLLYAKEPEKMGKKEFTLKQIGAVQKKDKTTTLVIDKSVQPALLGLDGYSHVLVFWWFDKNDTPAKRSVLQVHPRGNKKNPLTGIFACRCPMRPNLIALTLCKVIAVKDNLVVIDKIDAFDGTPVLDLKGYIPGYDSDGKATVPEWVRGRSASSE